MNQFNNIINNYQENELTKEELLKIYYSILINYIIYLNK